MPWWKQAAALAGLVLAAYATATTGSFHYDDFHSLVDNPAVRSPVDWGRLWSDPGAFSVDADKAMFRPLVVSSYAVQQALHGMSASGFLVGNLLLHLGCVLLFWRVAGLWQPASAATLWIAAALFAVHPVVSEPVNYVSSRSETLAALWLLLALWAWLGAGGRTGRGLAWGLPSILLALASKATAAALPLLLTVRAIAQRGIGGLRREAVWILVAAVPVAAYALWLSSHALLPDDRPAQVRSLGAQLATQLKAVPYYLHRLGVPLHLSVDPAFQEGTARQAAVWAGSGLLASLLWLAWRAQAAWRLWMAWPVVVALPASAVPLNVLVNEHRIYLAAAGACGLFARVLSRVAFRRELVGVLLALFVTLAVQRNQDWTSERALWAEAVRTAPQSARARVHLGNALRDAGQLEQAAAQFGLAVRVEPGNLAARTNLANTLYERAASGDHRAGLTEAIGQYERVLDVEPTHREALTNLGNALRLAGKSTAAAQRYREAMAAHPQHPDAFANLADLLLDEGQAAEAARWLEQVVALEPTLAQGHKRLGDARAMAGQLPQAASAYSRACALDPANAGACYNGAEVLRVAGEQAFGQGQHDLAARRWRAALDAYRHVLRTQGDYRQARARVAEVSARLGEDR